MSKDSTPVATNFLRFHEGLLAFSSAAIAAIFIGAPNITKDTTPPGFTSFIGLFLALMSLVIISSTYAALYIQRNKEKITINSDEYLHADLWNRITLGIGVLVALVSFAYGMLVFFHSLDEVRSALGVQ